MDLEKLPALSATTTLPRRSFGSTSLKYSRYSLLSASKNTMSISPSTVGINSSASPLRTITLRALSHADSLFCHLWLVRVDLYCDDLRSLLQLFSHHYNGVAYERPNLQNALRLNFFDDTSQLLSSIPAHYREVPSPHRTFNFSEDFLSLVRLHELVRVPPYLTVQVGLLRV